MASTRQTVGPPLQKSKGGLPHRKQEGQGTRRFKLLPVWYRNFHLEMKDRNGQKVRQGKKSQRA